MSFEIWLVLKTWRINRDGKHILLHPGDQIPEAAEWPNRDHWVARGYLKRITIEVTPEMAEKVLEEATQPAKKRKSA